MIIAEGMIIDHQQSLFIHCSLLVAIARVVVASAVLIYKSWDFQKTNFRCQRAGSERFPTAKSDTTIPIRKRNTINGIFQRHRKRMIHGWQRNGPRKITASKFLRLRHPLRHRLNRDLPKSNDSITISIRRHRHRWMLF